jgi:hypothetical protein
VGDFWEDKDEVMDKERRLSPLVLDRGGGVRSSSLSDSNVSVEAGGILPCDCSDDVCFVEKESVFVTGGAVDSSALSSFAIMSSLLRYQGIKFSRHLSR